MGFDIALQDERGKVLQIDPKNLLHRLIENYTGTNPILMEIDWYGDTVFNRLQIPRFLSAWRELEPLADSPEKAELIREVQACGTL